MSLTETPLETSHSKYAGFWRRVAATFIDSLILFLPNSLFPILFPNQKVIAFLCQFVVFLLYKGLMQSSKTQASLGKMALGIIVADEQGGRITLSKAILRELSTYLSALILGIGFLMAAWTKKKQALHDMLVHTVVLKKTASAS